MGNVPLVTEDASPEFLTRALRSTGVIDADTEVAEVEHDRIGEGVGFLGALARLTLRYGGPAHGAPSSVIFKLPTALPENRAVANHFRFYEREGRFYEHIGRSIAVRTPDCLFNHIDVAADEFALILEDFGSRTMVSQIVGLEFERASEAVRAIARMHAQWWDTPAIHALTWAPTALDPEIISAGQTYRDAWPAFLALVGDDLPEGSVALGERVGSTWESTAHTMFDAAPMTLCHGDYRADNLMFDDSTDGDDHVGVLDWQIAYRAGGIGDIAYLITQSMTPDMRRAHDRQLIEIWYEALSSALGRAPVGYSIDDAWDGYRLTTGTMTVMAVAGGGQMDPTNDRGRELIHDMATRSFSAALDLDAASLIPS
jgi:Ecdysteroid kinase-like family